MAAGFLICPDGYAEHSPRTVCVPARADSIMLCHDPKNNARAEPVKQRQGRESAVRQWVTRFMESALQPGSGGC